MVEQLSRLSQLIDVVPQQLDSISEAALSARPAPNKWSAKEILGHLCDSAVHNLSRFIHSQIGEEPFVVQKYEQDECVRLQHYQQTPLSDITTLWLSLNKSIIRVFSQTPEEKYGCRCQLPNGEIVTLQWLVSDYVSHMEHHLRQIAGVSI
ncbi:DinB family protein [Brevibacillus reuszeri]|uniref:DinB family protein n=1 Tax=Brevibacillus reuszeri TaxID=54915 RepID=UPI00289A0315|nr:DinB family protein [Brevibacillus reuszeri]